MKKYLMFIFILSLLFISGCQRAKTGEAIAGIDHSAQTIVLGGGEDSKIVAAVTDAAGALGITNSALVTDFPSGTNPKSIPNLIIIGTYIRGQVSNPFLSPYIKEYQFLTSEEAIILSGSPPEDPVQYAVIYGNTVDITVQAIKVLKQYGLYGMYADELNWGFTRIDSNGIIPHCSDQVRNTNEAGVDCGGTCAACGVDTLQTIRTLPLTSQVNTPFTVTIDFDLNEGSTETVAVEETLPAGCSLQGSSIKSMDATTPTWLFDDASLPLPTNPRVDTIFTYNVICTNSGTLPFSGQVSTTSTGSITTIGDTLTVVIGRATQCIDNDGDNHYTISVSCLSGNDCNDNNANIYPGNQEMCDDGIDNDCDGTIDSADSNCASVGVLQTIRNLPASAEANNLFTGSINLNVNEGSTETVTVEEKLPAGCSLQGSSINSIDDTTPTWLFDGASLPLPTNPRVDTIFIYDIMCTNSGTVTFSGQVSTTSTGSITTTGDTSIGIEAATQCVDNDGDGDMAISANCPTGNDCDDNNAARFPSNPEICDNVDNDCDNSIDEGIAPKQCGTTNVGACKYGTQTCSAGRWRACVGNVEPGTEGCDAGLEDEDCDGQSNEGCECNKGETTTCYEGTECEGVQTCDKTGTWGKCDGVTPSKNDRCGDDIDNDCDGTVDNDCWKLDNNRARSLFPKIRDKTIKFKIVIGAKAAASDSIGGVDTAGKLGITNTIFDTGDYSNQNIVIIGGPCANRAAADFLDIPDLYAAPGCENTIGSGGIVTIKQENDIQVLIAGKKAIDTRRAARLIARYEEFTSRLDKYIVTIPPGINLDDITIG